MDVTMPTIQIIRTRINVLLYSGFNTNFCLCNRHPVHNEYLPAQFKSDVFLKKAGDMTGKLWDEDALSAWEKDDNGGKMWEGRSRKD